MPEKFKWTEKRSIVAQMLGEGYTIREAAEAVGYSERAIYKWKNHIEFEMEVDRCSVVFGLASKAERNRWLMRAARQFVKDNKVDTGNDTLLDYIKEARMNTDGVKLDIATQLAAIDEETGFMAGLRSAGSSEDADEETEEAD